MEEEGKKKEEDEEAEKKKKKKKKKKISNWILTSCQPYSFPSGHRRRMEEGERRRRGEKEGR